jgi:hypothetical protein
MYYDHSSKQWLMANKLASATSTASFGSLALGKEFA